VEMVKEEIVKEGVDSLISVELGGGEESEGYVRIIVQSSASLDEVYETFERVVKLLNGNVREKLRDMTYQ